MNDSLSCSCSRRSRTSLMTDNDFRYFARWVEKKVEQLKIDRLKGLDITEPLHKIYRDIRACKRFATTLEQKRIFARLEKRIDLKSVDVLPIAESKSRWQSK